MRKLINTCIKNGIPKEIQKLKCKDFDKLEIRGRAKARPEFTTN